MSSTSSDFVKETLPLIKKLNNPVIRWFLRVSTGKCSKSGRTHLENVLDHYLGKNVKLCLTCKFVSRFVVRAIKRGGQAFRASREDIRELLENTSKRRGLISALKGIGYFGVSRPQVVGAPFLVVWNFTNACNLRCKHCYQEAGPKPLPDELTTKEAFDVVDQLDDAGIVALSFSGGEPLVRKDFYDVVKYAHDKGIYISVATNGTLITKKTAEKMKQAGVEYAEISLDGAIAATHDNFRGIPGSFDRTLKGIKNCKEAGIYTCIATTLVKDNLKEIPRIVELSKKLQIDRFMLFNFIPTGRGKEIYEKDVSPEEREKVLIYLYEELLNEVNNEGGIECFTTAPQFARVATQYSVEKEKIIPVGHQGGLPDKVSSLAEFIGGCGAGRLYCAVQPNGDVTPCVFLPIKVGNLREENFSEIWFKSKVFEELRHRDWLKGRCHDCEYRNICGGCRARAYGYYNNYMAPDPGCIRELEIPSSHFANTSN